MAVNSTPLNPADLARARRAAAGKPLTSPMPMGIRFRPTTTTASQPEQPPAGWFAALAATPTAAIGHLARPGAAPAGRSAAAASTGAPKQPQEVVPRPRKRTPGSVPAPSSPEPQTLRVYDAYACPACGARYRYPAEDHGCGPLMPVTVTVALNTGRPRQPDPAVLASYGVYACTSCGDRFGSGDTAHRCGPLTPVTVTITQRSEASR